MLGNAHVNEMGYIGSGYLNLLKVTLVMLEEEPSELNQSVHKRFDIAGGVSGDLYCSGSCRTWKYLCKDNDNGRTYIKSQYSPISY